MTFEEAVWIGLGLKVDKDNNVSTPRTTQQRVQDWQKHCVCGGPSGLCACIDLCECGHFRAEHDYDFATDTGSTWGSCEWREDHGGVKLSCKCRKFHHSDEDQ